VKAVLCPVQEDLCQDRAHCQHRCALVDSYAAPRQLPRMFEPDFGIEGPTRRAWTAEPRGMFRPFMAAAAIGAGYGLYRYFF
jgi:hypothetical protein